MSKWQKDGKEDWVLAGNHEDLQFFLQVLSASRWADAFVAGGELLLCEMMGEKAPKAASLTLITSLAPQEACDALQSLAQGARLVFKNAVDDQNEETVVQIRFGQPVLPKPRRAELLGVELWVNTAESMLAASCASLLYDGDDGKAESFYTIARLAEQQLIDGRMLYEALSETLSRCGCAVSAIPDAFSPNLAMQRVFDGWMAQKNLSAPSYVVAVQRLDAMIVPVYQSLLKEREFFGSWNPHEGVWQNYSEI